MNPSADGDRRDSLGDATDAANAASLAVLQPFEDAIIEVETMELSHDSRGELLSKYLNLKSKNFALHQEISRLHRLSLKVGDNNDRGNDSKKLFADFKTSDSCKREEDQEFERSMERRPSSSSPAETISGTKDLHKKLNLLSLKVFALERQYEIERDQWTEENHRLSNENFILKQSLAIHKEKLKKMNNDKEKLALEVESTSEMSFNAVAQAPQVNTQTAETARARPASAATERPASQVLLRRVTSTSSSGPPRRSRPLSKIFDPAEVDESSSENTIDKGRPFKKESMYGLENFENLRRSFVQAVPQDPLKASCPPSVRPPEFCGHLSSNLS